MKRTIKTFIAAGLMMAATGAQAATMTVYKSPACGCCAKWIEHVRAHGFAVKTIDTDELMAVKARAGVPDALGSCHTAMIGGYVVEGHVPAADIAKLLREKPRARGIAVAGMPMGSPGMEHGGHKEPFVTMLIGKDGKARPYVRH